MPALRNLTGQRFGRLVVIYRQPPRKWLCHCDCGEEKFIRGHNLLSGATKSCGCLQKDIRVANGRKPKKVISRCPCCGQSAPPLGFNGHFVSLSTMQQALFNIVKQAPEGIRLDGIRERLGVEDKNPQYVAATSRVLNKKIAKWGFKVVMSGGLGSIYRLVQL